MPRKQPDGNLFPIPRGPQKAGAIQGAETRERRPRSCCFSEPFFFLMFLRQQVNKKKHIFVDYKYRQKTRYSDLKTQHVCHHVMKLTRDYKGPPLGYVVTFGFARVALVAPVGITPQLKCVFEAPCHRGCSPCFLAPRSGRV